MNRHSEPYPQVMDTYLPERHNLLNAPNVPPDERVTAALRRGRALRAGALVPRSLRAEAREWIHHNLGLDLGMRVAQAALARSIGVHRLLSRIALGAACPRSLSSDPEAALQLALLRDDAESLLVALGVALDQHEQVAPLEARVRDALEQLDQEAAARESALASAIAGACLDDGLRALAMTTADHWWLRLGDPGSPVGEALGDA